MRRHLYLASTLIPLSIVLGCEGRASDQTLIVGQEPAEAGTYEVMDAGGAPLKPPESPPPTSLPESDDTLGVVFQNSMGMEVSSVSLPCGSDCVDIEAVARGGTPPYSFRWDDGSSASKRHVCPTTTVNLTIDVTDTAVQAAEFGHDPRTRKAQLAVRRLECPDAAVQPALPLCHPDQGPRCDLGQGNVLPEDLTVDVPGATVRYFAQGAALPAGRYRLAYVDGCNTYGIGVGWTVHGALGTPGVVSCSLVGDDGMAFLNTPGTELFPEAGKDGQADTYKECVAFNCKLAPLDFDFKGGKLGLLRDGGGELGAIDDGTGAEEGGKSPTFRLIRLDPCTGS